MDKLMEIIQNGEKLIERTHELLANEIDDLDSAGIVQLATAVSDLKAIHAESLSFTDDTVASGLVVPPADVNPNEYLEAVERYLGMRRYIMGELRDRVYEKTAKYDIAFRNKQDKYKMYNTVNTMINSDVTKFNADLSRINSKVNEYTRMLGVAEAGSALHDFLTSELEGLERDKQSILDRIEEKNKKLEQNIKAQSQLINGFYSREEEKEQEQEHVEEHEEEIVENQENTEDNEYDVEIPQNPELIGDDEDVEENDEQMEDGIVDGEEFIPVFPGGEVLEDEENPELPEEVDELGEEENPELPEEVDELEEEENPELPEEVDELGEEENPELPEEPEDEEEEDDELGVVPAGGNDDEEVEVVKHTDAKPTLLRKIGAIIAGAIVLLGNLAAIGTHLNLFARNNKNNEPSMEQESQLDEEDKEEVPEQTEPEDDTQPEEDKEEEKEEEKEDPNNTPGNNDNNNNGNNDNDNEEDKTPEEDKNPEEDKQPEEDKNPEEDKQPEEDKNPEEDKDPEEDKNPEEDKQPEEDKEPEQTEPTVSQYPVEIGKGETLYDESTGMEITHDGSAYQNIEEGVTITQEDRDLIETDHDTSIVVEEDMVPDTIPVETTGEEQTYEEAVTEMTDEEIENLDAAIADWAAQFEQQLNGEVPTEDAGLTLRP